MTATATPKVRILIAEDDEKLLRVLRYALGDAGFATEGVTSGEKALAMLEHSFFDVLVTDINLEGTVSGIALLGRCISDFRKTKVIMVTGMVGLANSSVGISGFPGATSTMFKPVEPENIVNAVRDALGGL